MLELEPLLQASLAIRIHVLMALLAGIAGGIILLLPKGTRQHRWLGRVFVAGMTVTAASSFFIHEIRTMGPFSAIHLLSLFVLASLAEAIRAIRRGNPRSHRQAMVVTYVGGIVVAGGFAFLPGRMMAKITYGGADGEFPIVGLFAVLLGLWLLVGAWQRWVGKHTNPT